MAGFSIFVQLTLYDQALYTGINNNNQGTYMAAGGRNFNFCGHCGAQNPAKNLFCSKCGSRVLSGAQAGTVTSDIVCCDKCGHPNTKTARFCAACSTPLVKDFHVEDEEDYVRVEIKIPQIDFENAKELNTLTKRIVNQRILVDLSQVLWVDSTGIGSLITLVHRFSANRQEIKFIGITKRVFEAIRAMQADNVLDIYESANEALVSWGLPPL
jgi:anti-sigma B factor antagonist